MSCSPGFILKGKSGFTLIEIIIAISILLIMATAFVPLFVYVAESAQANKARLVATKLASNEIEFIRSLPYQEIGNVGGNPEGDIEREKTIVINGTPYTIITDIWWVDDPSDDVDGFDPIPYDYKRVQVTVSSPSVFSEAVVQTLNIDTLATLEGGEEAFPGGNIRASVIRGWVEADEMTPIQNVRIDLEDGPDAPQTLWTNEFGQALFAIIDEGHYTVSVSPGPLGMIAQLEQKELEVVDGVTSEIIFELEYPCYLIIELLDYTTNQRITADGLLVLRDPHRGEMLYDFTGTDNGYLDKNFIGPLWPVGEGSPGTPYGIEVKADGYIAYELDQVTWNGQFSSPGETKQLALKLKPANASVTVISQGSGEPVPGATVNITGASVDTETSETGVNGEVAFYLADNSGDEYYCVEVVAEGYVTFGPDCEAFQMVDGQQVANGNPIDTYQVELQPDFRRIRVRTEFSNGNPRNNIWVRVSGPGGYSETALTGSSAPGEALFDNLESGQYTVQRYRGWWLGWGDPRYVSVEFGEYSVIYQY